jgi:DNA polymerase-3 subunit alpha
MIYALEEMIEAAKESKTKESDPVIFVPQVDDLSDDQRAEDEYEALGYFVSYNPLEKYTNRLSELVSTDELYLLEEGMFVSMGGLMTNLKEITTKSKKKMAFFELEDFNGRVEVVAFTHIYNKNKDLFTKNRPVFVSGKLEIASREVNGEEITTPKIILMKIGELDEGKKLEKVVLFPKERDDFQKIHDIIIGNPGSTPIQIEFQNAVLKTEYKIAPDRDVLMELESSCLTRRIYGN